MLRAKRLTTLTAAVGLVVLLPALASAAWTKTATGTGTAGATSVQAPATASAAPTTGATDTSMTVNWTAPAGGPSPTGYRVDRVSPAGTVCTVGSGTLTCNDTGRTASTSYSYTVRALVSNWNGTTKAANGSTTAAVTSVTSVSPSNRGQNANLTTVTISGANFASAGTWTANFGANIAVGTVTRTSATTITADITVAAGAATGVRSFSVTNGTTYTCANCFTVNAAPTITSPTTASPKAVTNNTSSTFDILGTGFASGVTVSIASNPGDLTLGTVTWVSATKITITVTAQNGNGHKGLADITVTNPDGGAATQTKALNNA